MARRLFVGGNWKSTGTVASVTELINSVYGQLQFNPAKVDVIAAPVAVHIPLVQRLMRKDVAVSAQNISMYGQGAYTGEIAADTLKDLGINWTLIGHSERRSLFGDRDEVVSQKVAAAFKNGLSVIACFGENLQERESNITMDVVVRQLEAFRQNVADWQKVVLAYEPVWAIGTGKTASPQQAQEVHAAIRNWLRAKVSAEASATTRIIYGGSVTDKNAQELISQADIDGFLVGGAALKPAFKDIVAAASSA
jgi:triosephosphate isomerase